ncbi:hypothetical protein FGG78_29180 [Thioclava sp. BHET1]|nr:hypothetical protein FGG78_29180 [Thioclava sp. BHET1]
MQLIKITAALGLAFALSGCLQNDAQRGVAGAAGGAGVAAVTGGDPLVGAVVGGAAGVTCHDLGVSACRNEHHRRHY